MWHFGARRNVSTFTLQVWGALNKLYSDPFICPHFRSRRLGSPWQNKSHVPFSPTRSLSNAFGAVFLLWSLQIFKTFHLSPSPEARGLSDWRGDGSHYPEAAPSSALTLPRRLLHPKALLGCLRDRRWLSNLKNKWSGIIFFQRNHWAKLQPAKQVETEQSLDGDAYPSFTYFLAGEGLGSCPQIPRSLPRSSRWKRTKQSLVIQPVEFLNP